MNEPKHKGKWGIMGMSEEELRKGDGPHGQNLWGMKGDYRVHFAHEDHFHTIPFHIPTIDMAIAMAQQVSRMGDCPAWPAHKDDAIDVAVAAQAKKDSDKIMQDEPDVDAVAVVHHVGTGKSMTVKMSKAEMEGPCPDCGNPDCDEKLMRLVDLKAKAFMTEQKRAGDELENKMGAEALMDMLRSAAGPSRN